MKRAKRILVGLKNLAHAVELTDTACRLGARGVAPGDGDSVGETEPEEPRGGTGPGGARGHSGGPRPADPRSGDPNRGNGAPGPGGAPGEPRPGGGVPGAPRHGRRPRRDRPGPER